ncbi:MAG: hypothetical protein AABX11_05360 [Nanoarchaeota archaeon]
MEISKEELIRINKGFGGILRNEASLDFAIDKQIESRLGEYTKLSYLIRAILVDHVFQDGNKKTAMFIAFMFANQTTKKVDGELLKHHILSIASKNISDIEIITERMKNAIK